MLPDFLLETIVSGHATGRAIGRFAGANRFAVANFVFLAFSLKLILRIADCCLIYYRLKGVSYQTNVARQHKPVVDAPGRVQGFARRCRSGYKLGGYVCQPVSANY
ncbi:MAG: hypothetical protein Q8N82_06200 [Deltaproteobacteria bacterium]|nr:hypothetical protein [Deltaproteobacteria bacterium]